MIIRKVRGENKLHPIILNKVEYELAKKLGISIEDYVMEHLKMTAKQRKWKWWLERQKEKNA